MNHSTSDSPSRRILAVHPGALGDVVLFGHLLRAIDGAVTLVARGEKAHLLVGLGACDRAMDFDALPIHELMSDTPIGDRALPGLLGTHDRVVSCFGGNGPRLATMCGATDAAVLPVRPPPHARGHLLDLWADLLGPTPIPAEHPWPVPRDWRRQAGEALAAAHVAPDRAYVVLHPGAGSRDKCWPAEKFATLARHMPHSIRPAVVLGPVERERGPSREAFAGLPVLDQPSLSTLAGVLSGAHGYVGNDSGVSHLAAAVGTPTVVLFGPTRAEQFAPRGRCVRTITSPGMSLSVLDDAAVAATLLATVRLRDKLCRNLLDVSMMGR